MRERQARINNPKMLNLQATQVVSHGYADILEQPSRRILDYFLTR
jgi:hypothetical protein